MLDRHRPMVYRFSVKPPLHCEAQDGTAPVTPHQHPMLALFLPYSVQTIRIAPDTAAMRMVFEPNREPWRQVAVQALFMTVLPSTARRMVAAMSR
jgi:hypothetical protein